MAEKKVKVTVETIINNGSADDRYELVVYGNAAERNGSQFIRYTEITEQGELKVLVKYDGEKIEATRKGYMHIKQVFELGKTTYCVMKTPLGDLDVLTKTNNINFVGSDDHITKELSVEYDLFVNDELVGSYKLKINVVEM